MSGLIVRNVDESVVQALKERASRHGRSAEAEHRTLLTEVLLKSRRRPLAEVLAAMPDMGTDADFARTQESGGRRDLWMIRQRRQLYFPRNFNGKKPQANPSRYLPFFGAHRSRKTRISHAAPAWWSPTGSG